MKLTEMITVSYFGPAERSIDGSAMGDFHAALISAFKARDNVLFRYVPIESFCKGKTLFANPIWIILGVIKLLKDAWLILRENSKLVFMVYPSVPLVPLTTVLKLPIAIIVYWLWFLIRRIKNQRFLLLIADLPLEQAEDLGIQLGVSPKAYRIFERLIVRTASHIVVPSEAIGKWLTDKYSVPWSRVYLYRVNALVGVYDKRKDAKNCAKGLRLFYAGDLRRPQDQDIILKVCNVINKHPSAQLIICGIGGELIIEKLPMNAHYMGVLKRDTLDEIASSCQVGLILYSPEKRYYNWTPTQKYSTYVGNGLAVLSTPLYTVKQNISKDRVGLSQDLDDLLNTLDLWIQDPTLVTTFKEQAESMAKKIRGDFFISEWLKPILDQVQN